MFTKQNPYLHRTLGTFTIKDIEAFTGIKCHTLRIWEQRYGIVVPKRSETNIRYYDDNDLKTLLNVRVLNDHGYRISEIARLGAAEIATKVSECTSTSYGFSIQIRSFISAMMSFDETGFHKQLNTYILQFGMEDTFQHIVFPFLFEVGKLWQVGTILPSHEHFVSNIIKQKIYVAIDGQVGKITAGRRKFLLFLPESEKHSLGLLYANYMIRSRGHEVLYLGQEVPLVDLTDAFGKESPDFILTMMTAAQPDIDKQEFLDYLLENWPRSTVLLTGAQFVNAELRLGKKAVKVSSLKEFTHFLNSMELSDEPLKANS